MKKSRRSQAARAPENMPICRYFTGATGLEPATSGVTGRVRHHDAWRRARSNQLICRLFSPTRRFRSAWLSQTRSRLLGHEWATKYCRPGQRRQAQVRCHGCAEERGISSRPPPYHPLGRRRAGGTAARRDVWHSGRLPLSGIRASRSVTSDAPPLSSGSAGVPPISHPTSPASRASSASPTSTSSSSSGSRRSSPAWKRDPRVVSASLPGAPR